MAQDKQQMIAPVECYIKQEIAEKLEPGTWYAYACHIQRQGDGLLVAGESLTKVPAPGAE